MWDLVAAAKRERVVVLTTHSMEEADVLGDRIGIIAAGRMSCLGTSLVRPAMLEAEHSFVLGAW